MEPIKVSVKFGYPREVASLEEMPATYKNGSADLHRYAKRDLYIEDDGLNVVYHDHDAIIHNSMDVSRLSTSGLKDALCMEEKFISALREKLIASVTTDEEKLAIQNSGANLLFEISEIAIV